MLTGDAGRGTGSHATWARGVGKNQEETSVDWKGWGVQVLTELELPHLYHSVARNSPKRPLLTEKWGSFQVCSSPVQGCRADQAFSMERS